ncbi:unnamed protein product, partial [Iphiclides podalirius]
MRQRTIETQARGVSANKNKQTFPVKKQINSQVNEVEGAIIKGLSNEFNNPVVEINVTESTSDPNFPFSSTSPLTNNETQRMMEYLTK